MEGGVGATDSVKMGCGLCTWRAQGDKGLTVQVWGSFCVSGVELPGSATSELC